MNAGKPAVVVTAADLAPQALALLDDFEVAIPQDTWIEQPWDMALEFATPICDEK